MSIRSFNRVFHALRGTLRREEGVVSTEYGLLIVLIAMAVIVVASALGIAVSGLFSHGAAAVPGA